MLAAGLRRPDTPQQPLRPGRVPLHRDHALSTSAHLSLKIATTQIKELSLRKVSDLLVVTQLCEWP